MNLIRAKMFFRNLSRLFLLAIVPLAAKAQFTFVTNGNTITITGYTGGGLVVIPSSTNGLPVTSIATGAFQSNSNLTGVTIPASITNMGVSAFSFCTNLPSVVIPGSVGSIPSDAFGNCTRLTNVVLSQGIGQIGVAAFTSCNSLTNVIIPASVTNFGDLAFGGQSLQYMFFQGNAPQVSGDFSMILASGAVIYYLPGTTNWGASFGGYTTALWNPTFKTVNGNFGIRTNRFGFTITGTANAPIVVEATTNLISGGWTALQTCTITNGSIYFGDATWTNYPRRSYRISAP